MESFTWIDALGLFLLVVGLAAFGGSLKATRPADRIAGCTAGIFLVILGARMYFLGD